MAKKKMGGLGKGLDSLFADLSDDMKLAEDMIKYVIAYTCLLYTSDAADEL